MKLMLTAIALTCLVVGYFEGTPIMFIPVGIALAILFFWELGIRADRKRDP